MLQYPVAIGIVDLTAGECIVGDVAIWPEGGFKSLDQENGLSQFLLQGFRNEYSIGFCWVVSHILNLQSKFNEEAKKVLSARQTPVTTTRGIRVSTSLEP